MAPSSYRSVLRAPGVRALLATSLVARLPAGMTGLAIILRVSRATGSYADAGAVTACFVVGAALIGPVLGRAADRFGRRRVLVSASIANAAGVVVLSRIPAADTHLLLVVAALAGACTPPVAAAVRSLWHDLVPPAQRDALYAVDSTLQELTFVAGPALVALIGSLAGTSAPLMTSGLLGAAGTIALAAQPAIAASTGDRDKDRAGRARVLTRPLMVLLASISALVLGFGALEVGIVAFADERGAPHQAGLLLATWSIGSLLGGFSFGKRAAAGGARFLPLLLVASAGGFAILPVTASLAPLYPLLLLAGVAIAPSLGCIYSLAGHVAAEGSEVEAFSWLSSGILVGAAAGSGLGGVVVQHFGSRVDYGFAALAVLLAGAITLALPRGQTERVSQTLGITPAPRAGRDSPPRL